MEPSAVWIAFLVVGALCLAALGVYLSVQPPPCDRCGAPMVAVVDELTQTFPPVRQRQFRCPRCGATFTPRPTVDALY